MVRRVLIVAPVSAALLLAALVGTAAGANQRWGNQGCLSNGVCWSLRYEGGPIVTLSGQPRAQDYVTNYYSVRIDDGRQFERSPFQHRSEFRVPSKSTQCRHAVGGRSAPRAALIGRHSGSASSPPTATAIEAAPS